MENLKIIIPIEPRTKKNSQMIVVNPKTKRPFIMPSALYKKYAKECKKYMPTLDKPIDYEVNVECIYYMKTRRRCDLTNLLEATDDILVECKILEDDNYNIIYSHDGSRVFYDKENPRVEITITNKKD